MKALLSIAVFIGLALIPNLTRACDLLSELAKASKSFNTKVDFHRADGGPEGHYSCADGHFKFTTVSDSFRLLDFTSGECDDSANGGSGFSVHTRTASITFNGSSAVYYDNTGGKHLLDAYCAANELRINLPDHFDSTNDGWMPFSSGQWVFTRQGNQLFFTTKHMLKSSSYMQTTTELQ